MLVEVAQVRDEVYMPRAMSDVLVVLDGDICPAEGRSLAQALDALAWCAGVSPRQAREATYRLWGHMIAMAQKRR